MKNTYLTSHFPLFAILLFSLSFAVYTEQQVSSFLQDIGLYQGMMEVMSEAGIKISILLFCMLFYFMLFAAFKLVAGTILELSLLFFSKDQEGEALRQIRGGSWIYLGAGLISLLLVSSAAALGGLFLTTAIIYFTYFLFRVRHFISASGVVGVLFLHGSFWTVLFLSIGYAGLRLYNSFIESLPPL